MSWSLTRSPRLSPAVLLGVSHGTLRIPARPKSTRSSCAGANNRPFHGAPHNFPEQLGALSGIRLALGAFAELKELPISAA